MNMNTHQQFRLIGPAAGVLAFTGAAAIMLCNAPVLAGGNGGGGEELPEYIELTGVVRDFRERNHADGHTDFEMRPTAGFGQYCGNISPSLSGDGKPVFIGEGWKIRNQWKDSSNRDICYLLYDPDLGDTAGSQGTSNTGGIHTESSFNQWYRDVPGVNMSAPLTLTLVRGDDGSYIFDDKIDPEYDALGGFFPIEDELYGNPGGSPDRNFHFTFELHTEFTYEADGAQVFKFTGDDDVWVYINGELVIDLGGVHAAQSQYVDLNRLGLEDGEDYSLDFFFAERHRTQSNFRIQTNLKLESVELPTITAAYD